MKTHFWTLAICLTAVFSTQAEIVSLDALLRKLDTAVERRGISQQRKKDYIAQIKEELLLTHSDEERYYVYARLVDEYRSYDTNLQLEYVQKKAALAERLNNKAYLCDTRLNMVEVLYVMGMYKESYELLQVVTAEGCLPEEKPYYYHICRTLYGLLADNSVTDSDRAAYLYQVSVYRDSILLSNDVHSFAYAVVLADKYVSEGDYGRAFSVVDNYRTTSENDTHQQAILAYCLADIFHAEGNRVREKENLIISAIGDLESAVREYISLRKLAHILYEEGDVQRAYNYMKCALEDATACNARLRTLEVSSVYPIIEEAYQLERNRQKHKLQASLICTSVLAMFLLIAMAFIFKQMRKLSTARMQLSVANTDLQHINTELQIVNEQLTDSNRIKEDYIGQYMDLCSHYIEKLDAYRRQLNKIARTKNMDNVLVALRADQFIEDEWDSFYANFDASFLHLYPDFVQQFNALLVEDGRILLKQSDRLCTELRIYALIRLGITDSVKIAHFLRYSVTTIYNYRTKIRNKAIGKRSEFEANVMLINSANN